MSIFKRREQSEIVEPARLLDAKRLEGRTQRGGRAGQEILPGPRQERRLERNDRAELHVRRWEGDAGEIALLDEPIADQQFRAYEKAITGECREALIGGI